LLYVDQAVDWIERKRQTLEPFEPLFLTIKQFLCQSSLNAPFNGGLTSYALAAMIAFYLQVV
jgi:DNA polymerase sigma